MLFTLDDSRDSEHPGHELGQLEPDELKACIGLVQLGLMSFTQGWHVFWWFRLTEQGRDTRNNGWTLGYAVRLQRLRWPVTLDRTSLTASDSSRAAPLSAPHLEPYQEGGYPDPFLAPTGGDHCLGRSLRPPITIAELRAAGIVTHVYCPICRHGAHIAPEAIIAPADADMASLAHKLKCTACGRRGGMSAVPEPKGWVRHLRATGQRDRMP